MKSSIRLIVITTVLSLSATSCLKTRAQLRGDEDNAGAQPVKAQVQDVQPQGGYAIDEVKTELTRMEGRIQDLERGQQQAGRDAPSKDEIRKLETRIGELEAAQAKMIESIKAMQEQKAAAAAAVEAPQLLDRARDELKAGNLDSAVEDLSTYLKAAKGHAAEEATFLRGEAYYAQKQYKKAIVDFSQFPEKYNKSKRMPAALLRIGQSFDALGMKDDAKGFYQELVEKYPKSPEAKKARSRAK